MASEIKASVCAIAAEHALIPVSGASKKFINLWLSASASFQNVCLAYGIRIYSFMSCYKQRTFSEGCSEAYIIYTSYEVLVVKQRQRRSNYSS